MRKLFTDGEWLFIAIMCAINFILLLVGLNGAAPYALEPDECDYGPHAIWMLKAGQPNPEWFVNPASTLYYPLLAYYWVLRLIFGAQLINPDYDEMRITYEHVNLLIKVPRFLDVLITVGLLPLVYLVARRWLGREAAVVATITCAVCPEMIRYGQTLRTDPLTDLLVVIGMYLVVKVAQQPEQRSLALSGALITALATSTRYFGLALTSPFVICYFLNFWQSKKMKVLQNLVIYSATVPILFFLTSPFVILDYKRTIDDLHFEAFSDFPEVTGLGTLGNFAFYVTEVMPFCLGWIMTIAVAAGVVLVLMRKRDNLTFSFLVMLAGFFVGTSLNPRHWYRWLLPMVPGCSMLAGYALFVLYEQLTKILSGKVQAARAKQISAAVACSLFAISLVVPLENDYLLEVDKIRPCGLQQMWIYIRDHIPQGTKIATDLDWRWTGKWLYNVQENVWRPDVIGPRPHNYRTPSDLARDGYRYVTCERWNRIFYQKKPESYPVESHFYNELRKHAPMLFATKLNTNELPFAPPYNRYSSYEIYDLRGLENGPKKPYEQVNPPDDEKFID